MPLNVTFLGRLIPIRISKVEYFSYTRRLTLKSSPALSKRLDINGGVITAILTRNNLFTFFVILKTILEKGVGK